MFRSFDGEYRRKPVVSIRGASKKESKQELLERAQRERQQREAHRIQNASVTKIQSFFRGYRARERKKEELRVEFDKLRGSASSHHSKNDTLKVVLARNLLFFFSPQKDAERLTWLCQLCVRERQDILSKSESWFPFRICSLVKLSLRYCANFAKANENIAFQLRVIEIFTAMPQIPLQHKVAFYRGLVSENYFRHLRVLIDGRVPPILDEVLTPPTPLAETLFALILNSLRVISDPTLSTDITFRRLVIEDLNSNFFNRPFSEQVEKFVLPCLTRHPEFPFDIWVEIMSTSSSLVSTPWLFYTTLRFGQRLLESSPADSEAFSNYLSVLKVTSSSLVPYRQFHHKTFTAKRHPVEDQEETSDEDEDVEMAEPGQITPSEELFLILRKSFDILNDDRLVNHLVTSSESSDTAVLQSLCRLCHNLLIFDSLALHRYKILFTLAFRPALLRRLWNLIVTLNKKETLGTHTVHLLTLISRGVEMSTEEMNEVVPLLAVFEALFCYLMVTIHDIEFYGDSDTELQNSKHLWMPFSLKELVPMSLALRDVAVGLIELAFPESRPAVKGEYQNVLQSMSKDREHLSESDTVIWTNLFKSTVQLVRQLYNRDTRRQFCPENHWISDRFSLRVDQMQITSLRRSRHYRLFRGLRMMTREFLVTEGPPSSAKEVRLSTVLRELPFVIPFSHRVELFHNQIAHDRNTHQGDTVHYLQGPMINIHVRRNFIYEDSFEKLSPENEPDLKLKMRVSMSNAAGLDEAGIDGGGIFREFLTELLKTCFDPNRGFFKVTTNQHVYPNPNVSKIVENFVPHYFFMGRMLGKALYENMLIDLPFASFFLSKMLGQHSINVDIDHLQSLDPVLYKNLLSLKTYDGNVEDLGLDFTMPSEELGQRSVDELKPGGAEILVNKDNRIEYIHLVADHILNKQIRIQCNAFRQGLADVINLDWLRMFSYRELQTLISGAETEIDVDDLMRNTKYGNGFDEAHETITMFWKVVKTFNEDQKRKLLKFATSCSRPPLLGFKELVPSFCIQNAGAEPDRLPTASTCMNLLKLPEFKEQEVLRTKLLYAIESGSGFELS